YFNSECSETITASLKEEFTKKLRGLSEVEKVSKLLCFMHQHSPYMEDYQQFGFEKFFFFEEYFSYPYSDCEDNSILFAYLVRKLTNCKVIGLEYDDHVATAVRFEEEVNGSYIVFNGEKYVICDPTYFGAPIGKYMPGYQNKKAKIIEIR
ncbi:hypothetical protein LJC12_04920, partial [Odoribacter sp. OttesenSCG-928-J03]|nr:hypothetical protein [Odoribacter sp. OttesenSCG-928-J03]